jgi:uncharacterized protein YuzE
MKISYDSEVDALYIRLIDGPRQCRTVRLSEEVALNMGPGEQLVGIEILDARQVLGAGELPKLVVENVLLAGS